MMDRFLDLMSLLLVPVGFLVGLVVLLILEALDVGFWISGAVLIVAALIVFGWQYLADHLSVWRLLQSKSMRKMHDRLDARDRRIGPELVG